MIPKGYKMLHDGQIIQRNDVRWMTVDRDDALIPVSKAVVGKPFSQQQFVQIFRIVELDDFGQLPF